MYWVVGVMGLLMIAIPLVFGATANAAALWSSIALGALVALVAGYKAAVKDEARWEYWVAGIAGIAAIAAPFVFGFTALATTMWTLIVLGVLLVLLDGYSVFTRREASS